MASAGTAQKIVDKYISGTDHGLTFQADAGDKPELIMATNAQFPPYEYYEDKKIVGIEVRAGNVFVNNLLSGAVGGNGGESLVDLAEPYQERGRPAEP